MLTSARELTSINVLNFLGAARGYVWYINMHSEQAPGIRMAYLSLNRCTVQIGVLPCAVDDEGTEAGSAAAFPSGNSAAPHAGFDMPGVESLPANRHALETPYSQNRMYVTPELSLNRHGFVGPSTEGLCPCHQNIHEAALTLQPQSEGLRLGSNIARGGGGIVYEAITKDGKKTHVIKVVAIHKAEHYWPALKELRVLLLCAHKCKYVDSKHLNLAEAMYFDDYRLHLVLPRLETTMKNLVSYCETNRDKCFSENLPSAILLILESVLSALCTLHNLGFAHMDVKTANILLSRNQQVMLADFGQAMSLSSCAHSDFYHAECTDMTSEDERHLFLELPLNCHDIFSLSLMTQDTLKRLNIKRPSKTGAAEHHTCTQQQNVECLHAFWEKCKPDANNNMHSISTIMSTLSENRESWHDENWDSRLALLV